MTDTGVATMNQFGLTFHHFGLAVKRPEHARALLTGLGYRIGEPIFDPEQNVNLCMGEHDTMPQVEIIYSGGLPGPIDKMVARHGSGIVYHLCYVTNDLQNTLARIAEANLDCICVAPEKPAILFDEKPVSFYLISGVGLIEIINENPAG